MWKQFVKPSNSRKADGTISLGRRDLVQAVRRFGRRDDGVLAVYRNGHLAFMLPSFAALAVVDGEQMVAFATHDDNVTIPDPRTLPDGLYGWPKQSTQPLPKQLRNQMMTMSQCFGAGAKEQPMTTKVLIRTSSTEFARLVAEEMKQNPGMTAQQAVLNVNAAHPGLYKTPSNAMAKTFAAVTVGEDASSRISRGASTNMPGVGFMPTVRGTGESKLLPKTREERIELRDAIYTTGGRLFPMLGLPTLARIADFGSGLTRMKFDQAIAKTPSLKVNPPELSRLDAGRLDAILRNLDPSTLRDLYVDRVLE